MRYLLLLIGAVFLAIVVLFPLPDQSQLQKADYDRGFNEGFQLGVAGQLETAQRMGAGEFYYDEERNRVAFRWYRDRDSRADRPDQAHLSISEPARAEAL